MTGPGFKALIVFPKVYNFLHLIKILATVQKNLTLEIVGKHYPSVHVPTAFTL